MAKQSTAKKGTPRKPAAKAKRAVTPTSAATKHTPVTKRAAAKSDPGIGQVSAINVRMYRAGTGDFFLLKFKRDAAIVFKMMIDCGCIKGGTSTFVPYLKNLKDETGGIIDLLVVTHEHADHINGFQSSAAAFKDLTFKKVWFAWTEDKTDKTANEYRKKYTKTKAAIAAATQQLNSLKASGHYEKTFANQMGVKNLLAAQQRFLDSMNELAALNGEGSAVAVAAKIPTMADILKDANVIEAGTEVEFLSPGDLRTDLPGAAGIRFFVLGPPRDLESLSEEEKAGEGYQKRESPSNADFALVNALTSGINISSAAAFDRDYESDEATGPEMQQRMAEVMAAYKADAWRQIDYDWLYGAGGLALRFQRSINNTSLVLAIQFEGSEKVLLFPGDAEYGNWISWHNGLAWTIQQAGETKRVDAEYLLNHTVFYKAGHHLSQNGTAKAKGLQMMGHEDLSAMVTLDFKKINTGWLNTMPNDLIGEELIRKTAGRLFFLGDYKKILANIKTSRVTVKQANENHLLKLNKAFEGKQFIDWEVKG